MKVLVIISQIISSVYFMGGMLAQHEKAKGILAGFEKGFKKLLIEFKKRQPLETIQMLLKFFGFLSGVTFVGILLLIILRMQSKQILFLLTFLFSLSIILLGSLFWVLKHKEVMKQYTQWLLILGGGPILFLLMDIFRNTELIKVLYFEIQSSFLPFFNLPVGNGILFEFLVVFGLYTGFLIVLYFITWFFATPTALIAWLIVASLIVCARAIDKIFPKKPIAGVFFILWLISFFYLTIKD